MAAIKGQVTRHSTLQLAEAEAETLPLVDQSLVGADFREGVRSFIESRPARFAPLGAGTRFAPHEPDAVAERFFAATSAGDWDTAIGMLRRDVLLSTYPGTSQRGVAGLAETWQKLRDRVGPWEYVDARRLVSGNSFCEQHRVRFLDLGVDIEVCVVASLDEHGQIVHLEEYADGQALREAAAKRPDELAGAR